MQLIDSHAHLDFSDFEADLDLVIARAGEAGVFKIVNIGADLARSKKAIDIAEKYEQIWATVGIHPEDCDIDPSVAGEEIRKLTNSSKKVIAIGECGLDYFYDETKKTKQKELFKTQIKIAKELKLPIVIHIRNGGDDTAVSDVYQILKENQIQKGVIHCFTLEKIWAEKFLGLGLHLGFTGIVTYKNAELVQESAKIVPVEKILIETDCPYLSPQKYRGQRNEPSYVVEVAKKISEIKNLSLDKVAEQTTKNAEKLFNI